MSLNKTLLYIYIVLSNYILGVGIHVFEQTLLVYVLLGVGIHDFEQNFS